LPERDSVAQVLDTVERHLANEVAFDRDPPAD
jgi:hypothetical protein